MVFACSITFTMGTRRFETGARLYAFASISKYLHSLAPITFTVLVI